MKFTDQELKKLKGLAKGTKGTFLIEYLERVKNEVADIRSELHVKPELEREVRLAVCNVIDELLIEPLKRHAQDTELPQDDWN